MLMPLLEWELGNLLKKKKKNFPHPIFKMHIFQICMDGTLTDFVLILLFLLFLS